MNKIILIALTVLVCAALDCAAAPSYNDGPAPTPATPNPDATAPPTDKLISQVAAVLSQLLDVINQLTKLLGKLNAQKPN